LSRLGYSDQNWLSSPSNPFNNGKRKRFHQRRCPDRNRSFRKEILGYVLHLLFRTKFIAGQNTRASQSTEGQKLSKIDRENEVAPPAKVDVSVGKAIAKARSEKDPPWKQSDLAQKINEKPSVINGMSPPVLEEHADCRL
jgi:hypothetical protein